MADSSIKTFSAEYANWTELFDEKMKPIDAFATYFDGNVPSLGFKCMLKNDDLKTIRLVCYQQYKPEGKKTSETIKTINDWYTQRIQHINNCEYVIKINNNTILELTPGFCSFTQSKEITDRSNLSNTVEARPKLYMLGTKNGYDCWCMYEHKLDSETISNISVEFSFRCYVWQAEQPWKNISKVFIGDSYDIHKVTKTYNIIESEYKPLIATNAEIISYKQNSVGITTSAKNLWWKFSNSENNTEVNYTDSDHTTSSKTLSNTDWKSEELKYLYAAGASINNVSIPNSINDSTKYSRVNIQYKPNNAKIDLSINSSEENKGVLTVNKLENYSYNGYFNYLKISTTNSSGGIGTAFDCYAYQAQQKFDLEFTKQNSDRATLIIKKDGSQVGKIENITLDENDKVTLYAFPACKLTENTILYADKSNELSTTLNLNVNIQESSKILFPVVSSTIYSDKFKVAMQIVTDKVPDKLEVYKDDSANPSYIFNNLTKSDNSIIFTETDFNVIKYTIKAYRKNQSASDSQKEFAVEFTRGSIDKKSDIAEQKQIDDGASNQVAISIDNTIKKYNEIYTEKYEIRNIYANDVAEEQVKYNFDALEALLKELKNKKYINTDGKEENPLLRDIIIEEEQLGVLYLTSTLEESYKNNEYADATKIIENKIDFSSSYNIDNNLIVAKEISGQPSTIKLENNYERVCIYLMENIL